MKTITADEYRTETIRRWGPTINIRFVCDHCEKSVSALVEFEVYKNFGDDVYYNLCADCLQAALDGVKAAEVIEYGHKL